MKRKLLLIMLLIVSLTGFCQDSIKVKRTELIAALKKIEDCKVMTVELGQLRGQNSDLLNRIASKDNTIKSLEERLLTADKILANYSTIESSYKLQVALLNEDLKAAMKSLRKQKRKTALVGIAGILASSGLTYLLITK